MSKLNLSNKAIIIIIFSIITTTFLTGIFAQNFPLDLSKIFNSDASPIRPMKGAVELQDTLRKIAKERSKSVVHVGAQVTLDPAVAEYYGVPEETEVTGSGFIVSEDGYVITNYHVIEGATDIIITLWNGEWFYAGVIGFDEKTDIALLRFQTNGRDIPTIPIGDSDELMVGDIVIAIGNPWGLAGSMTMGIVSATGRIDQIIEETAVLKNYIQTDVPINQGNSGGPLINLKGEVVAMNSALFTAGGGWDGISFSIPIKVVKRIIEDLAEDGIVERGYLGIVYKLLDKDLAEYFGLKDNEGVIITEVIEDSPADEGGLQVGDVILEFNGEKIDSLDELLNRVLATSIGDEVIIKVLRDGKEKTLKITIKKKPENFGQEEEVEVNNFGTTFWLGMELGNYEQFSNKIIFDGDGLVVVNIDENSHAYQKGIMPGDIIVEINNEPIMDLQELKSYTDTEGKMFLLKVYRSGNYDIIAVKGQ